MDTVLDAIGDWMERGGWVMWPLALCAFATLFVTLSKGLQWGFFILFRHLGRADWQQALDSMKISDQPFSGLSPYVKLMNRARKETSRPLLEAIEDEAKRTVRRLEMGLGFLDTMVTMAPMLGILGTVTGIIASFNLLGASTAADPAAVSVGIAEALITTATGLIVSMVALLPLNAGRVLHQSLVGMMERDLASVEHRLTSTP